MMGASKLVNSLCLIFLCSKGVQHELELNEKQCQSSSWRLPRRVKPVHYELELNIDSNKLEYAGMVEIDLQFNRTALENDVTCQGAESSKLFACDPTKILLHADKGLHLSQIQFKETKREREIEVVDVCRDFESSQMVVTLKRKPDWSSGGKLSIWFAGKVATDNQRGLFRSSYVGASNEDNPILATNFEPAHARKVFPLFDEPDLKATFGLTIDHLPGLKALSNMEPVRESFHENYVKVQFERTPRMSSYLLVFAVGQFDRIETTILDGKLNFGMWTPPGRAEDARLTLDRATRAYKKLQDYFQIEQPLKKLDLLAVDQMGGGWAMENWGLITFQTSLMLYGGREKNTVEHEMVAMNTVTHELAHQWFGNLVTMKWWDDLWLNEGFAEWMAGELCSELYPEFDCQLYYMLDKLTPALAKDADRSKTHPVKDMKLQKVDEIEKSFDLITYKKGHCVIRMLKDYLGAEQFKRGLRHYMSKHAYGNTEADDLWAALKEASGLEVESMIETWIYQSGYPLVEVRLSFDGKWLELSQNDFSSLYSRKSKLWKIPISVWLSNGEKLIRLKFLMTDSIHRAKLPLWFDPDKPGHWLKVNSNFESFYRVQYENDKLLKGLQEAVKTKTMPPTDRLNIIDDITALFRAKKITFKELVRVSEWFENEDNDGVIMGLVQLVFTNFRASEIKQPQLARIYSTLKRYYEATGRVKPVEGESLLRAMARDELLRLLVHARDADAIKDSLDLFGSALFAEAPYLQPWVYVAVALEGNEEQFGQLLDKIREIAWDYTRTELGMYMRFVLKGSPRLEPVEQALAR